MAEEVHARLLGRKAVAGVLAKIAVSAAAARANCSGVMP